MTLSSDVPTKDRLKFLVGSIFSISLYLRFNWASLEDSSYYTALLCNYLSALADCASPQLVEEISHTFDPFQGFSVQPDVEVLQAYQDWASTYDQGKNPLITVEEPHVQALLGDLEGKSVADIGCGTGRYGRYAVGKGARAVHGIDFSPAMLKVAQGHAAHLPNMHVTQGRIEALPLVSGRYDVVVCALALEHVADLKGAIHEMARLLTPGGILVISDFHPTLIMVGTRSGIRGYVHSIQDYFTPIIEAGLHIMAVREPRVGDLPAEFPRLNTSFAKLLAHMPFALILKAQKQSN
jgi:ubiquinone/menaquinone biosynthesis C-methylase UbiE